MQPERSSQSEKLDSFVDKGAKYPCESRRKVGSEYNTRKRGALDAGTNSGPTAAEVTYSLLTSACAHSQPSIQLIPHQDCTVRPLCVDFVPCASPLLLVQPPSSGPRGSPHRFSRMMATTTQGSKKENVDQEPPCQPRRERTLVLQGAEAQGPPRAAPAEAVPAAPPSWAAYTHTQEQTET